MLIKLSFSFDGHSHPRHQIRNVFQSGGLTKHNIFRLSVTSSCLHICVHTSVEDKTRWAYEALTSVCCEQLPSSGTSAVRKVRGARAQSTESKRRDKLLDTLTNFYRDATQQRRLLSPAATKENYNMHTETFSPSFLFCIVFFFLYDIRVVPNSTTRCRYWPVLCDLLI